MHTLTKITLQSYVSTLLHNMFRWQPTTGHDTNKRAAKISFHARRKNGRNMCHPYNHCTPAVSYLVTSAVAPALFTTVAML